MEIRPILSSLLRNKTGSLLVVLQIAITMAVIVNALFIIVQRLEKINRDPGIDVANMFAFQSWGFANGYNHEASVRADIDFISRLPGVLGVTSIDQLPVSNGGSAQGFRATPEDEDAEGAPQPSVTANYFNVTEDAAAAFGYELAAGRGFRAEEIGFLEQNSSAFPPVVIVTKDLATKVFGTEDALGKTIYSHLGAPAEVVGLIEHMHGSWVGWEDLTNVMMLPGVPPGPFIRYIVRTEPGRSNEVMRQVEEQLQPLNDTRMLRKFQPYSEIVAHSYRTDHSMTVLLMCTVFLLVSITSLGIVGLASFAVRQRTKQIGTRRAIGATRLDIMRYFMVENWLVTTIGVVAGAVLAVGFNMWLVDTYELEKLNWLYLPLGMVALWIMGQLAVLVPAIRAANIAPAIATRTV